jgi:hypothetical protein
MSMTADTTTVIIKAQDGRATAWFRRGLDIRFVGSAIRIEGKGGCSVIIVYVGLGGRGGNRLTLLHISSEEGS